MKFDKQKIEGYDSMTAEQKLAALEAFEFPDPDYSGYVKKDVFDKTASEAAEWRKKHNALLSEEDKKKQESEESIRKMEQELADLRREKIVADHKAKLLALGYDDELAGETAVAMAEGNAEKVFENQKKFIEAHDKSMKAQAMKGTPTPPAGAGGKALTREDIMKIRDNGERQEAIKENMELFTGKDE